MIDFSDLKDAGRPLRFFEEFSLIPHGSGNTARIADYLVNFAKARDLEFSRDEYDNVIIRKPATEGMEGRDAVIIQGHLDMVAEKKPYSDKDMQKDGLELYRDGDFLRAKDTTLGGDDGVALAYALAILDSKDISHPDFEALFTSDEEIGLIGATMLDPKSVRGRRLINVDSDEEGIFTVGCAGGVRSDVTLPIEREQLGKHDVYKLSVGKFKGGHSGIEIGKGRINAIKATAEALAAAGATVVSIEGGNADNAIPRDVSCTVLANGAERLSDELLKMKKSYADIEPDIEYSIEAVSIECDPLCAESSRSLLSLLCELPSGVIAMSEDIEGLVETSLNLGILRVGKEAAEISFSVRSAKGAKKEALCHRLAELAEKYGAGYGERGAYPAWEYKSDSLLRDACVKAYRELYGKEPEVLIIHAGLECGILSEKIEGLDCISLGPDNYDVHTTEERLSLSSFARVWEYLKKVLSEV